MFGAGCWHGEVAGPCAHGERGLVSAGVHGSGALRQHQWRVVGLAGTDERGQSRAHHCAALPVQVHGYGEGHLRDEHSGQDHALHAGRASAAAGGVAVPEPHLQRFRAVPVPVLAAVQPVHDAVLAVHVFQGGDELRGRVGGVRARVRRTVPGQGGGARGGALVEHRPASARVQPDAHGRDRQLWRVDDGGAHAGGEQPQRDVHAHVPGRGHGGGRRPLAHARRGAEAGLRRRGSGGRGGGRPPQHEAHAALGHAHGRGEPVRDGAGRLQVGAGHGAEMLWACAHAQASDREEYLVIIKVYK